MTRGTRTSTLVVTTVLMSCAMAFALASWWPVYQVPQFVVLAAVTGVLASTITVLGAVKRWSSAVLAACTFAIFVLCGPALAVPSAVTAGILPTLEGEMALFSGVALGWKQLLTIALPVGAYQALLVPVFAVELLGIVIGLSVALRTRRPGFGALAPVVVFVLGIAFGPAALPWPVIASITLALGLFAALFLWLVWLRWAKHTERLSRSASGDRRSLPAGSMVRAVASGVVFITFALAGAAAVAAIAPPGGQREVLRSAIEQVFNPRDYSSPLVGFRAQLRPETSDTALFTITGLPSGERIRLAALDSYDGVVFSVGGGNDQGASASFTRVPYRIDGSAAQGTVVSITFSVDDYHGVWTPTVGALRAIQFRGTDAAHNSDSFFYNEGLSTGAVIGGLSAGDSYTLETVLAPQTSRSEWQTAHPGSAVVPNLGTVPAELSGTLERLTRGVTGAGPRLAAIVDGLTTEGYLSHGLDPDGPASRSGHSSDRISELVSSPQMIGDAEQYSVAAAIMARELGFPSRVVYGYIPDTSISPVVVTGSMVSAWLEVDTAEYGWVAIDVTPPLRDVPEEPEQEPSSISRPPTIVQPPAEDTESTEAQQPVDSSQEPPSVTPEWLTVLLALTRIGGVIVLVLSVVAAPFLLVLAAKLRRRQLRRRASTALEKMSGGWHEFEDSLLDHGHVVPISATRTEIAQSLGGLHPLAVASLVDRAVFAPTAPSADDAQSLWTSVDELVASLDDGLTTWQRWRARVSLRSLGGYRVNSLLTRRGGNP